MSKNIGEVIVNGIKYETKATNNLLGIEVVKFYKNKNGLIVHKSQLGNDFDISLEKDFYEKNDLILLNIKYRTASYLKIALPDGEIGYYMDFLNNNSVWRLNLPQSWSVKCILIKLPTKSSDEQQLEFSLTYDNLPKFDNNLCKVAFIYEVLKKCETLQDFNVFDRILHEESEKQNWLILKNNPKKAFENSEIKNKEEELNKLIGLKNVKLEIESLKSLAYVRKKKIDKGIPVSPTTLHMVFYGNPGTGKTTVARLIAGIYHEIGLIRTSNVVEVSRVDLVEMYIGHTAKKVTEIFNSALGGVLFIDEAYSIYKKENEKDFGREAIDTLLKLMEDYKNDIVIIVAGYTSEMKEFLNSNPGLSSRFSTHIFFEDYSQDELLFILKKMCEDLQHQFSKGALFKLETLIDEEFEKGKFKSNARSVRNLFDKIQKNQSKRLSKMDDPTDEDLITFLDEDVPNRIQ